MTRGLHTNLALYSSITGTRELETKKHGAKFREDQPELETHDIRLTLPAWEDTRQHNSHNKHPPRDECDKGKQRGRDNPLNTRDEKADEDETQKGSKKGRLLPKRHR